MTKRTKKNETKVTRVTAYLRVSTDKQASEGHSLDAQRARLEAYAELFGLQIVSWHEDAGFSASSLERPGLKAALDELDGGHAEGLLVTKLDRLTRSVRDLADLVDGYFKDAHVLLSVGENIDTRSAAGRMTLNILTVIGQWEREAIAERTSAVMQHMKAEGMFTGGFPPFGFRVYKGELVADDEEQRTLSIVRSLRNEMKLSIRQIAKQSYNPRTKKPFHPTQIARML